MSGDILFPDEPARPEGNHVRSNSSMLTSAWGLSPGEEADEIHANLGDITNMLVVGRIIGLWLFTDGPDRVGGGRPPATSA